MSALKQHKIIVEGRVASAAFKPWIARHAAKIGVRVHGITTAEHELEIAVSGPEEMVQALALACSLGPRSVLVDRTRVIPLSARSGPHA